MLTYLLSRFSGSGSNSWCSSSSWCGNFLDIKSGLIDTPIQHCPKRNVNMDILAFGKETKSAACDNISPEISLTILFSVDRWMSR